MGLLALAIAPCLAVMIFVYVKDKYEKEPLKVLLYAFFGGVASTFVAITLEGIGENLGFHSNGSTFNTAIFAFIVVGFSEEFSKYLFLRITAYKNRAFNEPFDGIVYSVMVSMGFAMLENILYVFKHGVGTGIMRMFTAVPAHATFAIIMGYYVGKGKFDKEKGAYYHIIGILGAILFHGAYDFSLMQNEIPGLKLIGAIVSLIVAIRLSNRAMKAHRKISPFK